MFSRFKAFEVAGFQVWIDASWLLLAILVTWSLAGGYFPQAAPDYAPATYWWMGLAGLIGLGFSIVIHEFAHSMVARQFGMPVRGITLFMLGGVAEIEDEPPSPKAEALMAAAGPVTSVIMAVVLSLAAGATAGSELAHPRPVAVVLGYLAFINLVVALFNMMPAFPLDGGRILRAALWAWKDDMFWATRVAARIGETFGIVLIVLGILSVATGNFVGGMWWFLMGLFVRMVAGNSVRQMAARSLFAGQPVRQFMRGSPISVPPDLTVASLVDDYFYKHSFKSFPVVEGMRVLGYISVQRVAGTDRDQWPNMRVRAIMEPSTPQNTIDEATDAASALRLMQQNALSRLLVTRGEALVGVLSLRDLLNILALRIDLAHGSASNTHHSTAA